jgi:hypothetical protein
MEAAVHPRTDEAVKPSQYVWTWVWEVYVRFCKTGSAVTCDKLDGHKLISGSITNKKNTCQRNRKLLAQYKCFAAVSRLSDSDDSTPQASTGKILGKGHVSVPDDDRCLSLRRAGCEA